MKNYKKKKKIRNFSVKRIFEKIKFIFRRDAKKNNYIDLNRLLNGRMLISLFSSNGLIYKKC
jgi:hypothetical protein